MDTHDYLLRILTQPIFWIASIIGSVVLSVVANLITPRIAQRLDDIGHIRRTAMRRTQARFLGEIILIEANPERLTQAKLDSIHAVLLASFSMLVCFVLFTAGLLLGPFTRGITNIVFLVFGTVFAWGSIEVMKVGQKRMHIARAFERRQRAREEFARKNPERVTQMGDGTFLLEWDKKEFGVNLDEIPLILGQKAPKVPEDASRKFTDPQN